jgi:3-dehydroquinate synthase
MIPFKSPLFLKDQISATELPCHDNLLIIDRAVAKNMSPEFLRAFPFVYLVDAGENLKSLEQFPQNLSEILQVWKTNISRDHTIIALGGGSVGDFAGFVASVLKRGVKLIHIPSTWLAAIDSAHGGKTALNVQGHKNQIGTFYPAEKIYIFKDLLFQQPSERALDGLGEMVKMALMDTPPFISDLGDAVEESSENILWRYLEKAIAGKYKIVLQDPYETEGLRKLLNLGHTMGHALEVHYALPHGQAVTQGLFFALAWSRERAGFAEDDYEKILKVFAQLNLKSQIQENSFRPLSKETLKEFLLKDKKIDGSSLIDFIFLRAPGQAVRQKVSAEEIVAEAARQGWCQ